MLEITLFDIKSKGHCACWSPNVWKTRLVLNYKGLDYNTEWLELPDIAPTLRRLNVPPNTGNAKPYTLPMVRIRDGDSTTYVMDSQTIAEALERLSPSPPLRLDSPLLGEVADVFRRITEPLRPVLLGITLEAVLTERSAEYYSRVRAEALGMPIALYAEKYGGPRAWEQAQEPIAELAALLKREPGPFLTGENPTWADFFGLAMLRFLNSLDIDKSVHECLMASDPAIEAFYAAARPWMERDDH